MTPTPSVKDRRRHARYPRSRELAVFEFLDHDDRPGIARGRLIDISSSGTAVRTQTPPPPLEVVGTIVIYFEGFEFVSEARVARAWSDGFAVEFTDADAADAGFLNQLPETDA